MEPDELAHTWRERHRADTQRWIEAERVRILEFERKLEEGGIIAYYADESRFTIVTHTGLVLETRMFFYPEGPFYQVNDRHPY